jgi:hypothetical protein
MDDSTQAAQSDDLGFTPVTPAAGQQQPSGDDDLGFTPVKGPSAPTSQPYAMPDGRLIDPVTHDQGLPTPHAIAPPMASVSAHKPTFMENLRGAVGNSAVGRSIQSALPGLADTLNIHPTMTEGNPDAAQDANQLIAPEYMFRGLNRDNPSDPSSATENVLSGVGKGVGGLTTPGNMAMMAAPIGAVAGVFGKTASTVLPRLLSAGFTAQMAAGLYRQSKEFKAAMDRGDTAKAQEIAGEAAVTAPMAVLSGAHAAGLGPHGSAPPGDHPDYGVQQQEHPVVTGAKYIAAVKSGVPPEKAAAALGMTPQHQEAAHVANAIIPQTMTRAAAELAPKPPPAPAPPPQAPAPPPDGATVQRVAQAQTIKDVAAQAADINQKATEIAQGIPPPKPPEVPLPQGMAQGKLSQDVIDQTAGMIRSLPEADHPVAQREAVGSLAKWAMETRTPIGPDGRMDNIDSPKAAQKWAVDTLNAELDRQTQAAQDKADQAKAQQDEKDKAAEEQQQAAQTAAEEREQARQDAEAAKPVPIPDNPRTAKVRAALEGLSPDTPKADVVMAARKAAASGDDSFLLPHPLAEQLADEHIAKRAQQENAASSGITGEAYNPDQDPMALSKQAQDVASGKSAFLQVAPETKFKPDIPTGKTDGFVKTKITKTAPGMEKFKGDWYHPAEIPRSAVREAMASESPLAELHRLEGEWRAGKEVPEDQARPVLSDSPEQTQLGNPVDGAENAPKAEQPYVRPELTDDQESELYSKVEANLKERGMTPATENAKGEGGWGKAVAAEEERILRGETKPHESETVAAKTEKESTGNPQAEENSGSVEDATARKAHSDIADALRQDVSGGAEGSAQPDAQAGRRNPSNTFYSNPLDPELIKRYIGEPLLNMAEPLRRELESSGKIADVANSVHDLLQNVDRTNRSTALYGKALVKAMHEAGFSKEDGAEVFKHLEDPSVPLTDKQIQLRDEYIKPLNQATRLQYVITELIKSGKFKLDDILAGKVPEAEVRKIVPDEANYQHRIPVEKDTFVDKLLGDSLKRFRAGGSALSKVFSSAKRTIFKEIHGPDGEREVVAVKNGRVIQFVNKDNEGVLTAQIKDAGDKLAEAKADPKTDPARIDSLQAKVDELAQKKADLDTDGHTTVDLGEHLGGYVTTKELADKAVAPLEDKLAAMKTEFQTLHGSQSRAIASQSRIENLYYRIDNLEKEISAVRASVGPEEAKTQDLSRDEAFKSRIDAKQEQIDTLQKRLEDYQGRSPQTRNIERQVKNLPDRIADLNGQIEDLQYQSKQAGLEGKYWQDKNGKLWKFNRGTTDFISDRTGQQYHADARLAGVVNHMEVNKAMNAAVAIERSKGLLEQNGMAEKFDTSSEAPKGWTKTSLPQMHGYYFPAHIADAFDQFDYLQQRGAPNILEKINNFTIQTVLMNPLAHGYNIAGNWFTGRAAEALAGKGIKPSWYADQVKGGTEAMNTMRNMGGEEYQRLLNLGLDLRGADAGFDARTKDIMRGFTDQLSEDKESNKLMSALIGVKDAGTWLQHKNHEVTFGMGDLALMQSFYAKRAELIRQGVANPEVAARDWAHRMVGEYTTPVRLAGSAGLGRLAENPLAQSFFRYHFGYILRPLMSSIRESLGPDSLTFKPDTEASQSVGKDVNKLGQTANQQRAIAVARLAVMGIMATYVFPKILDQAAKKLTGDDRATAPRGGLLKFSSDAYETATGERSIPSLANSVFTFGLGTEKAAQLLSNRDDFSGRHIYGSDQDAEGKAKQMGEWLLKGTLPGQLAGRADQSGLRSVVESLAGFHFPLTHGIKAATEIRRDEGGSNPPDPQSTRVFRSIMAAAEQTHRSHGQDTSLATALFKSGKLTNAQQKTLHEAIHQPPIVFAVHGLEKPADVWQVFEHSTDDEKHDLVHDGASYHRLNQYQQQLRQKGETGKADEVLEAIKH